MHTIAVYGIPPVLSYEPIRAFRYAVENRAATASVTSEMGVEWKLKVRCRVQARIAEVRIGKQFHQRRGDFGLHESFYHADR